MDSLASFIKLVKSTSRTYYADGTLTTDSIDELYDEFMHLHSKDRRMVVEELYRDYLISHRPVLNDRVKVRLELTNRRLNMKMRNNFFTMITIVSLGTLTSIFIIMLVVDISNGGKDIYTILKNMTMILSSLAI